MLVVIIVVIGRLEDNYFHNHISIIVLCSLSCSDLLPSVYGSPKEYDLLVWTRNLSDVRRSYARMSYLPKEY